MRRVRLREAYDLLDPAEMFRTETAQYIASGSLPTTGVFLCGLTNFKSRYPTDR